MVRPQIAASAFKVAAVVGTILNVINNGELLWTHQPMNVWRIALNFAVPYLVSSYSAARNEGRRHDDT